MAAFPSSPHLGRNSGYYDFCYAKCSQQIYKGSVFSYDFGFGHFFCSVSPDSESKIAVGMT